MVQPHSPTATDLDTGDADEMMSACDRLFATHELVSLFLRQADPSVLISCQGVCQLWNKMIHKSQTLQENLFFTPVLPDMEGGESVLVRLNPVLNTHFAPILGPYEEIPLSQDRLALQTSLCRYSNLEALAWARDGVHTEAYARQAFARREASWRNMLLTQPPIRHLDWWHEWQSEDRNSEEQYSRHPITSGSGHERLFVEAGITLGILWDALESRLLRGCSIQVTFFVAGGSPDTDPSASDDERSWQRNTRAIQAGFGITLPRVRVRSWHVWPGKGPSVYQRFDVQTNIWEVQDELPFTPQTERERHRYSTLYANGVHWLTSDCDHDEEEINRRWSRSDGFQRSRLHLHSSRSGGPRRPRRIGEGYNERTEAGVET